MHYIDRGDVLLTYLSISSRFELHPRMRQVPGKLQRYWDNFTRAALYSSYRKTCKRRINHVRVVAISIDETLLLPFEGIVPAQIFDCCC